MICRGCDFILDTEFLGDGILDEEHSLRPGTGGVDPAAFNLADAVILGNIDDESQSFETSDSGFHMKQNLNARLYVSGRSQALMAPDAVPAIASPVTDGVRLTPFEKHVLAFIDGKRPVEVIRRAAGLDEAEVKTALATLADKGVVKVVGRALADFDPALDTAVRRAPPRPRMRGSELGAVALVGDEADRAIDEAFRTSVALITPLLANGAGVADTGDVFHKVSLHDSDLSSDIDQFVGIKGTDEIEKKPRTEPTSSTIRPSVMKGAINRGNRGVEQPRMEDSQDGIDASADASAVEKSIVDKSDGFDDFGQPSDVSTAVRAQEFSLSSSPSTTGIPALGRDRPPSGVFADLSDVGPEDSALPAMQSLADSRVRPRPKLPPIAPTPARAAMASESPSSASAELLPSKLAGPAGSVELERDAASGEVWGDRQRGAARPKPGAAPPQTVSTSLSDLLSDRGEEDEHTANVPPERAAEMLRRKEAQRDPGLSDDAEAVASDDESFEEPTAAGQPMPALPLPKIGAAARAKPTVAPAPAPPKEATGNKRAARPSAMVSMPDGAHSARSDEPGKVDETSGLHDVDKPQRGRDAAAEIFDEDSLESGFPSPITGPQQRNDSDQSTGAPSRLEPRRPERRDMASSAESVPSIEADSVDDASRDDETVPPSNAASDPEASQPSSSVEMVDSALVLRPGIRPAAKAVPLSAAALQARGSKPRERPPQEPASDEQAALSREEEDARFADSLSHELEADSEATMNLDAEQQQRRLGRVMADAQPDRAATMMVRGQGGGAAPIPSGFSRAVDLAATSRAKPSDENRRKAAKLFEESQKEAAAGKLGAARMNAKLASIYDPGNEEYRRQLEAWERPPTQQRPAPPTAAQPSQNSRPSDESQAEIKALYDEAQRCEDGGDVDAALDILEQGVERFPNAAAFHNRIGVILALRKRDYEGAVHAIQLAIDIDPDNLHYKSNLGKIVAKMRGPRPEA